MNTPSASDRREAIGKAATYAWRLPAWLGELSDDEKELHASITAERAEIIAAGGVPDYPCEDIF